MDDSTLSYTNTRRSFNPRFSGLKRKFLKPQTLLKIGLPILFLLVLSFSIRALFNSDKTAKPATVAGALDVKEPLEKSTINRPFTFPLKDEKGKEIGRFSYNLESAEVTDEIILKGTRANAVEGRQFLIVNLKLANNLSSGIQINSRDYLRLSVNGNSGELLAPDIHNDPVEVQAISTKYTRVGFPINTTDKNPTLHVGEINGPKTEIKLDLKK